MRQEPGRKTLALFSCGLPAPWYGLNAALTDREDEYPLDKVIRAAVAARTAIFAFGVPLGHLPTRPARDLSPLEVMARKTGGQYFLIDELAQSPGRITSALSACYVV